MRTKQISTLTATRAEVHEALALMPEKSAKRAALTEAVLTLEGAWEVNPDWTVAEALGYLGFRPILDDHKWGPC